MKKIWNFLTHHLSEDFNKITYGSVAILVGSLLLINYRYDFEDTVLDTKEGSIKFLCYFLFFAIPYYLCIFFYADYKEKDFWSSPSFWIKSLLALTVLSLDSSVPHLRDFINRYDPEIQYWLYKVSVNAISFVTVMLPLILFSFADRNESTCYGLKQPAFDYRPYFLILMLMIPVIIGASFHPSFLRQYPMYKSSAAHEFLHVPEWVTVLGYEIAYGLDFITVEFLFRGFMVIGMTALLGRKAVLAMTVAYCLLHFGKPAGEAISSLFGGYILGVIAYETRSIWGGIIVHIGIAWMMELISFIFLTCKESLTTLWD